MHENEGVKNKYEQSNWTVKDDRDKSCGSDKDNYKQK